MDQFLDIGQVAEMTGFARQTLYGLRSRGEGPASFLMAGRIRYRRSAVEQWIEQQEAAEQERLAKIQASHA